MTPAMVTDDEVRHAFAVIALFSGKPADRALAGWVPGGWLEEELDVVNRFLGAGKFAATTGEVA